MSAFDNRLSQNLELYSSFTERSDIKPKSKCKDKCFYYICLGFLGINLCLLTLSSIYNNVMFQMTLLKVKENIHKFNVDKLINLYYNISHNTYIMCITNPLIKNRDQLCYLG